LLDEPEAWTDEPPSVELLAARLGVSDRHLRRIFEAQFGVSPIQYLQTRRLLTAKQLLADTTLPVTQVALASGFASVRRFNAAFTEHYGLNPTQLRREGGQAGGDAIQVRLGYRPPYDVEAMIGFFRTRRIEGMEFVSAANEPAQLGRTLAIEARGHRHAGWLVAQFEPERSQLRAARERSLRRAAAGDPPGAGRLRPRCRPAGDQRRLHGSFPPATACACRARSAATSWRCAPCWASRSPWRGAHAGAAAGRSASARPIATPYPACDRCSRARRAGAAEGDALGQLGIVRQRQAAIVAHRARVADGRLQLHAGRRRAGDDGALKELPGIGDWTAQYIAMRALRWPDAFPSGDIALQKALKVQDSKHPARAAEAASQAWKPWRSYAVVRAWHGA
jgi:AraC family transcriptional regulator of adaptative response / DNA-3-methyladenine glycosylase II